MPLYLILLSGFAATSLMTAFSYIAANLKESQFREPELLNILISRARSTPLKIPKNHFAGWLIHYTIGYLFVGVPSPLELYRTAYSLMERCSIGLCGRDLRDWWMDRFL